MTVGEQARWWGIGLIVFIIFMVVLADVMLPFILGAAIAYFADPVADKLEARGVSRTLATVIITFAALLTLVTLILILTPLLIDQIRLAVDAAPGVIGTIRTFLETTALPLVMPGVEASDNLLTDALAKFQTQVQNFSVQVLESALNIGIAGINFVTLVVFTPVVAFYLLLDWDRMIERIDDLLPREHAPTIRKLATDVDKVLDGFVHGQLSVCLILGVFYAVMLMIIGVPFGLLVGLFAGLVSFIPFVGSILGGLLSVGIAAFHFWSDPIWIAATAVVFVIGQVVEGNYLTPKLVGGSVGLHPVWLMFALSAFGGMFGFTGLLIAVPVAAVIGVFLRFSIDQYKSGRLYRGVGEEE
ncbi:MAG: AI-2E family transporter [Pseudomonadota bacterium]